VGRRACRHRRMQVSIWCYRDDETNTFSEDRALLKAVPRIAGSLLMIQEAMQAKPVATVATLRAATGRTTPTVNSLYAKRLRSLWRSASIGGGAYRRSWG